MATSVDNASEIAEITDGRALQLVCRQQKLRVHRMAESARLVHATHAGGLLVLVTGNRESDLPMLVSELIERLRRPVAVGRQEAWPLVTLGAQICHPSDRLDVLSRQARTALANARSIGSGTLTWYDASLGDLVHDRMAMVSDLAAALEDDGQLKLHFQPVRDLRSNALVGAEALLRWQHPARGAQAAMGTVETAERSGLIGRLGHRILDLALAQLSDWRPLIPPGFRLHVNVSPTELRAPAYVEQVECLLQRHGVPASMLLLELTEAAAMGGHPPAVAALERLAELGVGIGIDDFGIGYSSIAYLRELPVDTVKVDRSLIAGVATSAQDYELAGAVAHLLSVMPVRVLAEGIESAEQLACLRELGYAYGQGYHLGRPAPPELLTHRLQGRAIEHPSRLLPAQDWPHLTLREA